MFLWIKQRGTITLGNEQSLKAPKASSAGRISRNSGRIN
jgi:hypothetical protein